MKYPSFSGLHSTPGERIFRSRKSTLTPSSVNFERRTAAQGDMGQYLINNKLNNTELSGCEKTKTGIKILTSGKRKFNFSDNLASEGQFSPNKIPKLNNFKLNSRLGVTLERLTDEQKMGENYPGGAILEKNENKTAVLRGKINKLE